jgi:hypothetical protein
MFAKFDSWWNRSKLHLYPFLISINTKHYIKFHQNRKSHANGTLIFNCKKMQQKPVLDFFIIKLAEMKINKITTKAKLCVCGSEGVAQNWLWQRQRQMLLAALYNLQKKPTTSFFVLHHYCQFCLQTLFIIFPCQRIMLL